MIIYLYGSDSYRRREKLKEIISQYQEKHSKFSVLQFDLAKESGFVDFNDFIKSRSLFDDARLGIIYNGLLLKKEDLKVYKELLKENIKEKEPVFIILDDKKPVKDFNFLLEKPVLVQAFDYLSESAFYIFLKKEAEKRNLKFDKDSDDFLVRLYSRNTWGLITELDKLALLDEKVITREILKKHLNVSLPLNIFEALNAFRGSKNIGLRLSILEELLSLVDEPAMIFNMFAVSPYSDKSQKIKMADYDAAIKSGKLEYDEVLLDMVLESRS